MTALYYDYYTAFLYLVLKERFTIITLTINGFSPYLTLSKIQGFFFFLQKRKSKSQGDGHDNEVNFTGMFNKKKINQNFYQAVWKNKMS